MAGVRGRLRPHRASRDGTAPPSATVSSRREPAPAMTIHLVACCSDMHDGLPPALDVAVAIAWLHADDVYKGVDHTLMAKVGEVDLSARIGKKAMASGNGPRSRLY